MDILDLLKKANIENSYFPFFEKGKVLSVVLNKDKNNPKTKSYYAMKISLNKPIPAYVYNVLHTNLEKALQNKIRIQVEIENDKYNARIAKEYIDFYIETVCKDNPSFSFIKEQEISTRDGCINISYDSLLKENLLKDLQERLEKYLSIVGFPLKLRFIYVEPNDFDYEKDRKELFEKFFQERAQRKKEVKTEVPQKSKSYSNDYYYNNNQTNMHRFRKNKKYSSLQLHKIDDDCVDVETEGKVFFIDDDGKNKKKFKVYISNFKKSILCHIFVNKNYDSLFIEGLLDKWVKVKGTITYNPYEKENIMIIDEIEEIASKDKELVDKAPIKRVELHAHTNMSAYDGISAVSELITQAAKFNFPAIAITDHNSLQSFPDAQITAKKLAKEDKHIKIIYGVETNMVPKTLDIIKNPTSINLQEAEYVMFDLETTGLSCRFDKIIEFGAVKFKNHQVIETIDILINPGFKLSGVTTKLTHITDSMLKDKKTITDEIENIMNFLGDSILVAHNATFDIGFIEEAIGRKVENPIIDTLPLSRYLYKDIKSHALGSVARHNKIDYDEASAHRGDYDAKVLADIFDSMLHKIISSKLATTHSDLKNLTSTDIVKRLKPYHTNLLVKNNVGLKNLFKIISVANTEYYFNTSLIPRDVIEKYREGLLVGSSCARGEIFEIASTKSEKDLLEVMKFYDYIEIQPIDQYQILVDTDRIDSLDSVRRILNTIIDAAKKLGKIIVATGDVHYTYEYQAIAREVMIDTPAVGGGYHPLFDFKNRINKYPIQNLKTTDEMLKSIDYVDHQEAYQYVVENTLKITEMINDIYPIHDKLYPPKLENSDEDLRKLCYENAYEMYGNPLPKIVEDRLEKELHSIITNGYSVIYIIAAKSVLKSNEDGFLVGSRGSVGSSFVATCSGITEVNPLKPHYICPHCKYSDFSIDEKIVKSGYDLADIPCPKCNTLMKGEGHNIPFETFLGFKGDKVPDIDLNFSGKYQDKIHKYIRDLFGKNYVYRAGTISTSAVKTSFGIVKKYYEKKNINVNKAEATRIAKICEGIKRTTGQHPGGLIVIPDYMDVYDFTPIQYPADDVKSDWYTTHFDFNSIHDNVLKLDMLGHVDPTALRMLQNLTGVSPKDIPMNDPKVLAQFNGENSFTNPKMLTAIGLPEFGTTIARRMLLEAKPQNFSELIQICGLAHGTDVWFGNQRDLIVNKTCQLMNLIGCRDDIMVTMMEYGLDPLDAFNIMENVRKQKTSLTDAQEMIMRKHDVPDWYIDACKKIKYMFPKAHAVAYTMMSIRVAYFKYYYPLEYYATFFTTRCDQYDIEAIVGGEKVIDRKYNDIIRRQENKEEVSKKEETLLDFYIIALEMYRRGISFSNVSLEKSHNEDFLIDKDKMQIIPPFRAVDGIGPAAALSVVEARKDGEFLSKEDLSSRTKMNTTNINKLERLGVLDGIPDSDQLSFQF